MSGTVANNVPFMVIQTDQKASDIVNRKNEYNRKYYQEKVRPRRESEHEELIQLRHANAQLINENNFLRDLLGQYKRIFDTIQTPIVPMGTLPPLQMSSI